MRALPRLLKRLWQQLPRSTAPVRLGLPWRMSLYSTLNGHHPLVASFVKGNSALLDSVVLNPYLLTDRSTVRGLQQRMSQHIRVISPEAGQLMDWLNFSDQLEIESQASHMDMLFLHTTPLYLGSLPWIFHFESFPTLFMPFLFHGNTTGVDLKATRFFQLTRDVLESPQCRRIFSHMHASLNIMDHVFDSPLISSKLHHVPIGITIPPAVQSLEKYNQGKNLRILFTNSLHQDPQSFYLRGGHHLVEAFVRLRRRLPDIELTVLSSMPNDFAQRYSTDDLKGVNWIGTRVDDTTLEKLLLDHHLFALPTAGLHSYSFLRAISHGCVPIVSDAPGYDEWIHGIEDSVLLIRGVRDLVYHREPAGWFSDCYAPFIRHSEYFVQQIYDAVITHSRLSDLQQLAERNIEHCGQHFSLEVSHATFNRRIELQEILREGKPLPYEEACLVEEHFHAHNIVRYLERYWGIPLALGHVDLMLEVDREKSGIISARYMTELKERIVALDYSGWLMRQKDFK